MSPSPESIFVIIPCYNEAAVLPNTVDRVLAFGYSVVVVDDASKDDTPVVLQGLPIHYARHKVNLGQGAALQTGIDIARAKGARYYVTFDADGQHEAADIQALVNKLEQEKVDMVFGSRFLEHPVSNLPRGRRWLLQAARYVNYFFSGILLSDAHNGLRCFNQKTAETIRITENRMAHASELLMEVARKKLSYTECPVHIHYSDYSLAKGQGNRHGLRILFELILYKLFR